MGRFISVDPLQFDYPQLTPFNYAGNKPITYIDVNGLQGEDDKTITEQALEKVSVVKEAVSQKIGDVQQTAEEKAAELEKEAEKLMISNLIETAETLQSGVANLSEEQKQEIFKTSTKGTIGILLYEFATGGGNNPRNFTSEHQIVKDLSEFDITEEAINDFYDKNIGKNGNELQETKYYHKMSPNLNIGEGFNLVNAFVEHTKILTEALQGDDPLRLFLGSMTYTITPKNGSLEISIKDQKTRNSLFFHGKNLLSIANNVERKEGVNNPLLSTTRQSYNFKINIESERLKTWKQKALDYLNN